MKAAWYERNGTARDVLVVGELPTPRPAPGEVLVRVHFSGINPSDVKSRRGRPVPGPRVVPHSDGAGIIEAVGEGVPESRIGERVWLWNGQWKRAMGTAAEFIALPSEQAVGLPDGVDFAVGACLGIPGLTAMHAVNLLAPIKGKSVLVTGAASAVGHYVTQMAAARGARVIGTASAEKAGHARSAGATDIIDYKKADVAARVLELTNGNGVNAVIDMDFSTTARLLSAGILGAHGKYVCYGSNVPGDNAVPFGDLLFRSLTLQFFLVYELQPDDRAAAIADLDTMLRTGALDHTIGARFPLAEIVAAHEAVEAGQLVGNVVLDLVD
ncbi:NADPH:quinone reductase [Phyllobacterium lublinensis]|uniref:NADPH:quinone reductase n=1 Tax=Phyllobacterium lublinensis TaxID=2875708 RepID=UPI001CC9605C|nr:NADPH:quinone reductase [Phyllobacterium sp. 2063]MBZ9653682.1 NADPH:quinone reductase [Phyllobacterium sp. 2063]